MSRGKKQPEWATIHPTVAQRLKWVESLVAQGYTFSEAVQLAWATKLDDKYRGWYS